MVASTQQVGITAGSVIASYLCGAIPFGLLVGRLKGIDIRQHGSGNIGATNVGRVLGRPWGILAFLLDVAKGMLPVLVFGTFARAWMVNADGRASILLLWAAVAAAAVCGHLFPIYLGFKGGKGVATSLGALLGMYPFFTLPGLVAFGLWGVVTFTTRYVSVGSVVTAVAFPMIFAAFAWLRRDTWGGTADLWPLYLFSVIVAVLVVYRHRGNLERLRRGEENRIGSSAARST